MSRDERIAREQLSRVPARKGTHRWGSIAVRAFEPAPEFSKAELLAEHVDDMRWWTWAELQQTQHPQVSDDPAGTDPANSDLVTLSPATSRPAAGRPDDLRSSARACPPRLAL